MASKTTPTNNKGIALCLSGGGYRAAAFHLGALRRLNELGVLARVNKISSVSGGSIIAAHLAQAMVSLDLKTLEFDDWDVQIKAPFCQQILNHDIRTIPFIKQWLWPFNWFSAGAAVSSLETQYEKHLTSLLLEELPQSVKFTFCATNLHFGKQWIFERDRMGDSSSGYRPPQDISLAKAVAASSCFPPIFLPMSMAVPNSPKEVQLSDGGIYDNLGLHNVWRGHQNILVSDGGAPFTYEPGTSPRKRLRRYMTIANNQGLSLRRQWLNTRYKSKELQGSIWLIGSDVSTYGETNVQGYSTQFAREVIANIRTDMNAFKNEEIGILENHGYLMAEAALKSKSPELIPLANLALPIMVPQPELMDEGIARKALEKSHSRAPFKSLFNVVRNPFHAFKARKQEPTN